MRMTGSMWRSEWRLMGVRRKPDMRVNGVGDRAGAEGGWGS